MEEITNVLYLSVPFSLGYIAYTAHKYYKYTVKESDKLMDMLESFIIFTNGVNVKSGRHSPPSEDSGDVVYPGGNEYLGASRTDSVTDLTSSIVLTDGANGSDSPVETNKSDKSSITETTTNITTNITTAGSSEGLRRRTFKAPSGVTITKLSSR